jgi:hypothetical protein
VVSEFTARDHLGRETPSGKDGDALAAWAELTGHRRAASHGHGALRFAFYGRVSTEDWQDPVTSRARQRDQAAALVAGHGRIVAEFFDTGYSRTLAWARRPQAAAVVAALADPDRGWDAIVIGEYERAFYGAQYASSTRIDRCQPIRSAITERAKGRHLLHGEVRLHRWREHFVVVRLADAAARVAVRRHAPRLCFSAARAPAVIART